MIACIKRAAGEEIVPRTKSDPILKDTAAQQTEILQGLTTHFIPVLPKLLNKFSESPEIVPHLAQIPQYFLLDVYAQFNLGKVLSEFDNSNRAKHLTDLLDTLTEIFSQTVDKDALDAIAGTLQKLRTREHTNRSTVDGTVASLMEKLVAKFKTVSHRWRDTVCSVSKLISLVGI